jgi:hypothetical protein
MIAPLTEQSADHRRQTVDVRRLTARVGEVLHRHPAVGFAVGVVRNGSLEFFHGHGVADIASSTPVTEDTVCNTRPPRYTRPATAPTVAATATRGSHHAAPPIALRFGTVSGAVAGRNETSLAQSVSGLPIGEGDEVRGDQQR